MSKMIKIFSALLLSIWLVGMYRAKFGQDTLTQASPDILILGTDAQQYPYAFVEQGQVVGFDADLFSAIATRIGKKRVIKKLSPDQLSSQLSDNFVHVLAQDIVQEKITDAAEETEKEETELAPAKSDTPPSLDATLFLSSHPYFEPNFEPTSEASEPQPSHRFFVVSKQNAALLTLLNNALDEIKEDGTLVVLQKKWDLIS